MRAASVIAIGVVVFVPAAFADAPPPPPFEGVVPKAEGLVLDGKPDEDAWKTALVIPAEPLEGGPTPEVKVLTGGGCLWVSAKVAEDPGFAMGIRWMIAPDKTASAADCVALSYSPQDTRCPEFTVRGPRGAGRKVYRFDGRADVSQAGVWTIETCLALADLALPAADTPLRLAVAVTGRTPNRLSCAPPDSAFHSPSAFALVRPPIGGWETVRTRLFAPDLSQRDEADQRRLEAWNEHLTASSSHPLHPDDPRLKRAVAERPDLLMLRVALGDAHRAIRNFVAARNNYEWVLEQAPGLREAQWSLDRLAVTWALHPNGPGPFTYDMVAERVQSDSADGSFVKEAGMGLLDFRRGDFAAAARRLEPLAAAHAFDEEIVRTARQAKEWGGLWGQELALRKVDEARGDLPRARIVTPRGPILLELFEDAAPNTVKNFVWLAEAGAYDGTAFDRSDPLHLIQGGQPEKLATRWAIRTETSKRKPFRGTVAMRNDGVDTGWARFFITTGTLPEVDGDETVFGRVIDGQDVLERLVLRDLIEKVEVVRKRPDVEYRPITVAGTPAPPPK